MMIDATLGHFRILELLGRGGFGEVYKARDTLLDRIVALKVIPAEFAGDVERRERLKREARAASALNHPNVCTIYELAEFAGGLYIAMELVDGPSLRQLVAARRPTIPETLRIATKVAAALGAAHDRGIIHRDISAANIMLTAGGEVKIVDFGLATTLQRWIDGAAETAPTFVTLPGTAVGTVSYMSPEQLLGQPLTPTSDVFSFGVVLYEMATGVLPFRGASPFEIADRILHYAPDDMTLANPEVPAAFQRLVLQMLAKRPEERPASARAVSALIEGLAQPPVSAAVEASGVDSGRTAVRPRSIAVLPFANMSDDAENEYFSDGLAEELTNALAGIEGLKVASRTSAFAFKAQNVDIRDVASRLNVETVLEGSVRRSGTRLRITAQLINADDGYHLWSQRYDRDMADVFAVQDEIASSIAATLKGKLVDGAAAPTIKRYTDDIEAYNLYLKGRYYWNRRYEGVLQKALECFNKALERAPQYALAYSGIADCFSILAFYNYVAPRDGFARAEAAAERALAIDDELAEAHASLGLVRTFFEWDFEAGEREFRRSIQLNPRYGTGHYWYAAHEMALGRCEASLASLKRACEAEPVSANFSAAVALMSYFARRFDDAIEAALRALDLDALFGPAHAFLGWAYTEKAMYDEATAAWEETMTLLGGLPTATAALARTHALAGRRDQARQLLRDLDEIRSRRYVSSYHVAGVHVALGEHDDAIAWLDRAREERSNWLAFLRVDPVLDPLRGDHRLQAIDAAVFRDRAERVVRPSDAAGQRRDR